MMENGIAGNIMVQELLYGLMAASTKESGRTAEKMEKGSSQV